MRTTVRSISFVMVLSLAAGIGACGRSRGAAPAVERWISGAPSDELLVSQLERIDCLVSSRFDGDANPAELQLEDASTLPTSGRSGWTVRGGERAPRILVKRNVRAEEVNAVRIAVSGVRRGNVRLQWFEVGSRGALGTLELTKAQGAGTLHNQFYFDLAGKLPADRPVEVELQPTSAAGEVVTVEELCLGRADLDADRVRIAARVPWKATIDGEIRDVLLQPRGGLVERESLISGPARLSAGFGRLEGQVSAVRLVVSERGGDGAEKVLLDRKLMRGELDSGWFDFDLDLPARPEGRRSLRLEARPDPEGDPSFVGVWSAPRIVAHAPKASRPNIVLISLDTVRADHLSLYGYSRSTTPGIDAWTRERGATVFRDVVPASGWTLPSHFSLFTGLEAFRHPANYNTVALDASAFSFLAERLLEAGYRTQAYTGGGFVHPVYGLARGFEAFGYWASKERRSEELESNLEDAGRWLDRAAKRIADGAAGDPFLLFLHTYEVHTPNAAREPYFGRFSRLPSDLIVDVEPDGDLVQKGFRGTGHSVTKTAIGAPGLPLTPELAGLPVDLYDSALAYVDDRLTPLLQRLSRPPFDRDTIVVIFSDHGEALGEDGLAGHATLAASNLHVPLVIALPSPARAKDIPSQVRLIDLFPTLLELAGLSVPEGIDGRSLRPLLEGGSEPVGRPAWSYSASTNHGLALIGGDGVKLVWHNSLWKPVAGELRWYRRDGYRETLLREAPSGADSERMIRQVQQVYAREANGLRFEARNQSGQAVRIAISSDLVDPASVKSPAVDGVRLDWSYIGFMETTLDSAKVLALQFERTQRRQIELRLEVRPEKCPETVGVIEVSADVEQLRQPMRRHLALEGCDGKGPLGAGVELEIRWQGPLPADRETRSDAALREDLKALGYLH